MERLKALVDTSVVVGGRHLAELEVDDWAVSVVTLGELHAGVLLARDASARAERLSLVTALVAAVPILPIDADVASRFGQLRAATGRHPTNDLWIASTALAYDLMLVTCDEAMARLPLVMATLVSG